MVRFAFAAILTVILAGCAGRATTSTPPPGVPAAILRSYPAARWLPAGPTYAFASPTVRDGQQALGALIDLAAGAVALDRDRVAGVLRGVLGVDPLSPEAVAAIGIDITGGSALYSTRLDPTLVVPVVAPDKLAAFVDRQRARGMRTQSAMVDGTEVFTTEMAGDIRVSWTAADGWLWVHFARPGSPEVDTEWLQASRHPGAPTWIADWQSAQGAGAPAIVGVGSGAALSRGVLGSALACVQLVAPVRGASFAVDAQGDRLAARVVLELAQDAAKSLGATIHAPPPGWSTAARTAPLAVQWNVDLDAARGWIAPCLKTADADLAVLDSFGVRTARVILERFDPDKRTKSRGAVSADLEHNKFLSAQLDLIPMRSTLERKRTFGPYAGASIAIPFGPTIEYVLTDSVALAGLGEGVLASVTGGQAGAAPLLAIDLSPPAMPREAWAALFDMIDAPSFVVDQLMRWRDAHITLALDGTRLVLDATGARR